MSSDNTVADRLLYEARRKTAREQSPALGRAAMVVGIVALVVSLFSIVGSIVGGVAVGMAVTALRRPAPAKQAKVGLWLGVTAILVGVLLSALVRALG